MASSSASARRASRTLRQSRELQDLHPPERSFDSRGPMCFMLALPMRHEYHARMSESTRMRTMGAERRRSHNITTEDATWEIATELARRSKISVSQLFDRLVLDEARRRDVNASTVTGYSHSER